MASVRPVDAPGGQRPGVSSSEPLQVGILTRGKPTLGMVLVSLLLQENVSLSVHIVDTAPTPVVKRDEVIFAMRLAFDRGVHCAYEYSKEKYRAFSVGRLTLLESMAGHHISFMDDDIVLASGALAGLASWVAGRGMFGYASPLCKTHGQVADALPGRPNYSPGGIIYQDEPVRRLLLDYYSTTSDVLDARGPAERVWENAFLSELFPALGRVCAVLPECMSYHLDYRDRPTRYAVDERLVAASVARAHQAAQARGIQAS